MSKRNAVAFEVMDEDRLSSPGAYRFFSRDGVGRVGFRFGCPCGCGLQCSVYVKDVRDKGPVWTLTGAMPKGTLSPSIGFYGRNSSAQGYHWHGFLRDGVFEEC